MNEIKRQCGFENIIIIMGDLNVKAGSEFYEGIVEKHGLGGFRMRVERDGFSGAWQIAKL